MATGARVAVPGPGYKGDSQPGGPGAPCAITGSEVYYAGGGGGNANGAGGIGGGGNGAVAIWTPAFLAHPIRVAAVVVVGVVVAVPVVRAL